MIISNYCSNINCSGLLVQFSNKMSQLQTSVLFVFGLAIAIGNAPLMSSFCGNKQNLISPLWELLHHQLNTLKEKTKINKSNVNKFCQELAEKKYSRKYYLRISFCCKCLL